MVRQNALPKFTLINSTGFRTRFRDVYAKAIAEQGIIITGAFGQASTAIVIFEPGDEKKMNEVLRRIYGPRFTMPKLECTFRYLRNNFADIRQQITDTKSSAIIYTRAQPHRHSEFLPQAVMTYIDYDDPEGVNKFLEKFRGYTTKSAKRLKQKHPQS